MTIHIMSVHGKAFAAVTLALTVGSCSPADTKPDGRADVESMIATQSNGLIKVLSYEKTNGMDYTAPVRAYKIDYEVEVEFVSDGYWKKPNAFGWDGRYCASKQKPSFWIGPDVFDYQPVKSGTHMRFKSDFTYQMTDNGWQPVWSKCSV